jgi:hypothetical protein
MFKTTERIVGAKTVDALLEIIAELYRERIVASWNDYAEAELDVGEFKGFVSDMLLGSHQLSKLEEGYQGITSARFVELCDIDDPHDILEAYPAVLSDFDDWWDECHQEIKEDNAQAETEAWLSQPWR